MRRKWGTRRYPNTNMQEQTENSMIQLKKHTWPKDTLFLSLVENSKCLIKIRTFLTNMVTVAQF